jgi:hypothetical protein
MREEADDENADDDGDGDDNDGETTTAEGGGGGGGGGGGIVSSLKKGERNANVTNLLMATNKNTIWDLNFSFDLNSKISPCPNC